MAASSFDVASASRNLVSGITRWDFSTPEVHLGVQVGKFDPQDIYVGEQVQLLSGQSATVLEVSIRALLSSLQILSQVVPETYYSVAFDDGTFCDNHDPEEVKYDEGVELTINTEVCSTSQTKCRSTSENVPRCV